MTPREHLIKTYTDFFTAGCKDPADFKYGIEAEHFIVDAETETHTPYLGENGVGSFLEELSVHFNREYRDDGYLLGLFGDDAAVSLEPGSQLELSIYASADINKLARIYRHYIDIITPLLTARGQKLRSIGYQPVSSVHDIEILPRGRYRFMNEHFRHTGDRGINMMRGTAACQVALDYSSEADFINKYQYACLLLPLLSFISSNSPVFEGQENSNPLIRTVIWRGVDSARSCIVPTTFAADFSFARYAEYIIDQAAIFEMKDGKAEKSERKVDEVLAAKTEWDEDFLLYLSLVFPDVRLRQYIEIRIADAMDEERTFAYMALIKGLFSDAAALGDWLADVPRSITAITAAQDAIMKDGMQAQVYGRPVKLLLEEMMGLAARQLTDCGERERLAVL